MYKSKNLINELGIFFFALIAKLLFVFNSGLKIGSDTAFYLNVTHRLLGLPSSESIRAIYYIGYPLFMSVILILFSASSLHLVVVVAQVLLGALSCVFLFKSILLLIPKRTGVAWILTTVYIFNFDVLQWDPYILTDSFNLSIVVITTYFFLKLFTRQAENKIKNWPFLIIHFILHSN